MPPIRQTRSQQRQEVSEYPGKVRCARPTSTGIMGLCALQLQLKGLCACADEGGELKALSHIPKSEGFMRCFARGPYSRHRLTATPSMLDLCISEDECKKDALHTAVQVCPSCAPPS